MITAGTEKLYQPTVRELVCPALFRVGGLKKKHFHSADQNNSSSVGGYFAHNGSSPQCKRQKECERERKMEKDSEKGRGKDRSSMKERKGGERKTSSGRE